MWRNIHWKDMRSLNCLIFMMGIPMLVIWNLYTETYPLTSSLQQPWYWLREMRISLSSLGEFHRSGTFQRGAMMWDANRFVCFRRQIQHTKNDYLYDIIKQYQHQILTLISWSGQLGINAMSPWPRGNMDIACIRKRKCLGMLAFDWKLIKFWRGRWKLGCSGVVTHWRALRNQF